MSRTPPSTPGRLAVVCAADAGYIVPLAAMLASLGDSLAPGRAATVHVLTDALPDADRRRLEACLPGDGVELQWVDVDRGAAPGLPLWGRMSAATYDRLLLPELLPDLDRAIWLDCDLVVAADLGRLWDVPMNGHGVLAVQDMIVPWLGAPDGVPDPGARGLDPDAPYFNAGVMVIDLAWWREENVVDRTIAYLRERENRVVYWDQEALNVALAGRWGALDPRWNQNAGVVGRAFYDPPHLDDATYRRVVEDPWIVHFSGNVKPWVVPGDDDARERFFRALDRTPWAGWRPRPTLARRAIAAYETSRLRAWTRPIERHVLAARRRLERWRDRRSGSG